MSDGDPYEMCECGHPKRLHWLSALGARAGCSVSLDKRHVATGGSELYPCDCRIYSPMLEASP